MCVQGRDGSSKSCGTWWGTSLNRANDAPASTGPAFASRTTSMASTHRPQPAKSQLSQGSPLAHRAQRPTTPSSLLSVVITSQFCRHHARGYHLSPCHHPRLSPEASSDAISYPLVIPQLQIRSPPTHATYLPSHPTVILRTPRTPRTCREQQTRRSHLQSKPLTPEPRGLTFASFRTDVIDCVCSHHRSCSGKSPCHMSPRA